MIGWVKRLWSRWQGPKPYTLTTQASASIGHREPDGSGWLDPYGEFHHCTAAFRNHATLAFHLLNPGVPPEEAPPQNANYERDLEQRRYVKLTESLEQWSGWHKSSRLTREQCEVITDWYLKRGRKLPQWLIDSW